MLDPLIAISPLDGRYRDKLEHLGEYFSEYALIRRRVEVEIEWFIFLCNNISLPGTRRLNAKETNILRALFKTFDLQDAERVKTFEKKTNHDVKAVEYFIKEHLKAYPKLFELAEFIHFGCTSEDINNLAYCLILKSFFTKEYFPVITGVAMDLHALALRTKESAMLARTHGQPATPTTMGKELIVFLSRLERQLKLLQQQELLGKLNGASGNFNAHCVAYPAIDWLTMSKSFVESLGLTWNAYTTQIEPHDHLAEIFHNIIRINTIFLDLARDIWTYISLSYLKQKIQKGEVGSSTMPHKVNPIDFENAEGNLGLANAVFDHLAAKLPVSRLQRDLSDSTVLRNIGVSFGYSILAYKSLLKGFGKLELNKDALKKDLDINWEVLAEAIQTVLRRHKVEGAYEKLKGLTRGKQLNAAYVKRFIQQLKISEADKNRLLKLTPYTYTGIASKLVEQYKPLYRK